MLTFDSISCHFTTHSARSLDMADRTAASGPGVPPANEYGPDSITGGEEPTGGDANREEKRPDTSDTILPDSAGEGKPSFTLPIVEAANGEPWLTCPCAQIQKQMDTMHTTILQMSLSIL